MEHLFFTAFAAVAIISAICVVTLRNPIHSAFFLVIALLQVAGFFVLLRSPFLMAVQIFIYVGAIIVFILFMVFVVDFSKVGTETSMLKKRKSALFFMGVLVVEVVGVILFATSFTRADLASGGPEVTVEVLARVLFTQYLFPFEIVSVLLLVAMVAAIVMVKKV